MKPIVKPHLLNRILPASLRNRLRDIALRSIPTMRHLDMPRRLAHMKRLGFEPRFIVDAGSARGEWARLALNIWPAAHVFGIDPNASNVPFLQKTKTELPHFDYVRALLGPETKTVRYVENADQTSLYEPVGEKPAAEAAMITLDSLLPRLSGSPDFIKMDVQGFELEALRGAEKAMSACGAILLEVSFVEFFDGVPVAAEVVAFMAARGFYWYDIMGIYRRPYDDALGQLDVMFLRSDHVLRRHRGF